MSEQTISCPKCNEPIQLSEALTKPIEEELRQNLETEYEKKIESETTKLQKQARQEAQKNFDLEMTDLREQLKEKEETIGSLREQELNLRKQKRELEEAKKNFELEVARQVDDERQKIAEQTTKDLEEKYRFRDQEKDKKLNDLARELEEVKRKAEQGSQQLQGEVAELELEKILSINFPEDQIEPVPTGVKGADVLQRVYNGQCCGTIVWESKRTKHWNKEWIPKIKDDQRDIKAEFAVIVSEKLPDDVPGFAKVDGVWVTGFPYAVGLAVALRESLTQVAMIQQAEVGKNQKMEMLYSYLSGTEFKQRVEAVVEAFVSMKGELEKEKRAMNRIWAKREKEMERVIRGISGMYGDMQGIIGASLPAIEHLELPESIEFS